MVRFFSWRSRSEPDQASVLTFSTADVWNDISGVVKALRRKRGARITQLISTANLDPAEDLQYSNWLGANFEGQDLRGYNFTGAVLADCNFRGADLAGASLRDADVTGACFDGADLSNCDLTGVQANGAPVTLLGAANVLRFRVRRVLSSASELAVNLGMPALAAGVAVFLAFPSALPRSLSGITNDRSVVFTMPYEPSTRAALDYRQALSEFNCEDGAAVGQEKVATLPPSGEAYRAPAGYAIAQLVASNVTTAELTRDVRLRPVAPRNYVFYLYENAISVASEAGAISERRELEQRLNAYRAVLSSGLSNYDTVLFYTDASTTELHSAPVTVRLVCVGRPRPGQRFNAEELEVQALAPEPPINPAAVAPQAN